MTVGQTVVQLRSQVANIMSMTDLGTSQHMDPVLHDTSGLQTAVAQKGKTIQSVNLHKELRPALWHLDLPTEVLSHIFRYCLPPFVKEELLPSRSNILITTHRDGPFYDSLRPSNLEAPLLLTKICRRWREVAMDMPDLWCRLFVEVGWGSWERALCYDSWLKCSRGRPLSLTFQWPNFAIDWAKLRNLLQPYFNHVSSLSVNVSFGPNTPTLMFTDFLTLEELSLSVHHAREDPIPAIARSISQLPCTLHSLSLIGMTFRHSHFASFNLIWAHLTNVAIDTMRYPADVLHLLQIAPNLSSLTTCAHFDTFQALEPCTHIKLQFLHFTIGLTHSQGSSLLYALSLPNLRTLNVRRVPQWPHEEFKAFLARSMCPLESLIVSERFRGRKSLKDQLAETDEQRLEYVTLVPSLKYVVREPS
ncbi:hypothetical protein DEU56DRAFT_267699 [Suillus clintonianus]|uniref:uncharacterized protein n=1 Tax=Suillus clintonianus TaxID=1904413 RepID=UPI001B87EBC6|nr:uncharacterized protein DEU56DRAFT_267699 [Suillus clintonianus]KAG2141841.1 hypothetical protein DEU56DRAFT_267699 [Suillus clintonianus]